MNVKFMLIALTFVVASVGSILFPPSLSADCLSVVPAATYGKVTQPVFVANAGTYRVWSRIKTTPTANAYYFQSDNGCVYNVGGASSIPSNVWTWVNYQDGDTTSVIDTNFSAGTHTLTYTGKAAGLELDRVLLLLDPSCVPIGMGDNCATTDITPPALSLDTPENNAVVSGTVPVDSSASDAYGIQKVEFYLDDAAQPFYTITGVANYNFSWDTTAVTNGVHTLVAKAIDNNGNVATSSVHSLTVANAAATIPTLTPEPTPAPMPTSSPEPTPTPVPSPIPISLPTDSQPPHIPKLANHASITHKGKVHIKIKATDNVAVARIDVYVDGVLLATAHGDKISTIWDLQKSQGSAGAHTVLVRATDTSNNVTSRSVVVYSRH